MRPLRKFCLSELGASAVEFALVLPVFIALTIGAVNLCVVMYANATLHYAVDDAARCMSVKKTAGTCDTAANTQTYALNHYRGPGVSPTFVATTANCGGGSGASGSKITATATYHLNTGLMSISVPLTATSCFPL